MARLNYSSGKVDRAFRELIVEWTDDDLSERADAVVEMAKTPNFGFTDRSGKLRASIKKKRFSNNPRVGGWRVVAGEGVLGNDGKSYAAAVERGHPRAPAHPYLNPSLQAARK